MSLFLDVSLTVYLKCLVLLQHSAPCVTVKESAPGLPKRESQSTAAFPSINVQLVRLSCDLNVATKGLIIKVHAMMAQNNTGR